jgi:chromatin remodeling complex protein RSC6
MPKKSTARGGKKTTRKSTKSSGGKSSSAFMSPVQPDAALAAVIGNKAMPRTQITKHIWEYVKKNKLQDDKDKRQINADEKLRKVFNGKSSVSMFEMTKYVNNHLTV